MTIFRVTMTALGLAYFMSVTVPAAAQDVRRPGKTSVHTTHAKKRTPVGQAKSTAPRGPSGSEQWMERGSVSTGGGGGGGY